MERLSEEALIKGRNNSNRICIKNAIQRLESIKKDLQGFEEKDKYNNQIETLSKVIEQEIEKNEEIERD